ncbi:MAG TPA: hypothetical protein VM093_04880 [Aeromicrobium sp.]|nr:hypothetical protein [Aeromicrobium sp.]
MTVVNGPSSARGEGVGAVTVDPDVPVRADGVQLIGELEGSGYREPVALARRSDGQTIQLTPLVYLVLEAIDGRSSYADVARTVSERFGRAVSDENVRALVADQLRPAGLATLPDGSQPELVKSNPLLALRFKYAVTDPERTRQLTAPFTVLFNPVIAVAVLALLAIVSWWVLFDKGLASATNQAFARPGLLLLVIAVTVVSAGFHEFGHAAAARRAGAQPGVMGAGLYLIWPAFYTDVTDSYRLGRRGRVLTDLGGLYFNAIVAVGITGVWWLTHYDALLLIVATQILQMVRQLIPLVRFDGYHVLADLTGVPDLFHRIKPTLLGILPWRWKHPESTVLKPWARVVVTTWVLLVVPILACTLYVMVIALPRVLGTAWAGVQKQSMLLQAAWSDADVLEVLGRAFGVVAVLFPVLAVALILGRLARRLVTRTVTLTAGRPLRQALAGLLAVVLLAGVAAAWWPREGAYRPIQAYEGGTLTQAAQYLVPASAGLRAGQQGVITTAWPEGATRPTRAHPQLAMVLVPRQDGTAAARDAKAWVFPFNRPMAPGPGDNQAMAVNTKDNTVIYDVAFALVWIDDSSPALNSNEAYAFASCSGCAAVAVAFQVVLVTGDNHVAAPQNIAAAVNYDCVDCVTYALAVQLFVTVDKPLDTATLDQLAALWRQIAAYGANIGSVPLDQIQGQLNEFEDQMLEILGVEEPGDSPTSSPSGEPTDGTSPSPGASDTAAPAPTASSTGTPLPTDTPATPAEPTTSSDSAPESPSTESSTAEPAPSDSSSP